MKRSDVERLDDARGYAEHAITYGARISSDRLEADRTLSRSLLFDIVVVGEALHFVSADIKGLAPEIPWRGVWSMRNRVVHGYWSIDHTVLESVLAKELPSLVQQLDQLIAKLHASGL